MERRKRDPSPGEGSSRKRLRKDCSPVEDEGQVEEGEQHEGKYQNLLKMSITRIRK